MCAKLLGKFIEFILNVFNTTHYDDYKVILRHNYKDKKFKIIKGLREMKSLRPKSLMDRKLYQSGYYEYYIWLCYIVYKPKRCELCGNEPCAKGLYPFKYSNRTKVYMCRECAIGKDHIWRMIPDKDKEDLLLTCKKCYKKKCNNRSFIKILLNEKDI